MVFKDCTFGRGDELVKRIKASKDETSSWCEGVVSTHFSEEKKEEKIK